MVELDQRSAASNCADNVLQVERIASDKRIELKIKFSFIFLMYIYNFVTSNSMGVMEAINQP
jgi:hypothetical protein